MFAIHMLVSGERLGAGPGGRPTREEMEPADYLAASYYERWLFSAERRLERKGTIAPGEVDRMIERLRAGEPMPTHHDAAMAERIVANLSTVHPIDPPPDTARFGEGQRVRVERMRPAGHTRCPRYVRGAVGVVEHVRGADRLPDRAVRRTPEPVYTVAFASNDLWGLGEDANLDRRARPVGKLPGAGMSHDHHHHAHPPRRSSFALAHSRRSSSRRGSSRPTRSMPSSSSTSTTSARRTAPRSSRAHGSTPRYRERLAERWHDAIARARVRWRRRRQHGRRREHPEVHNMVVCTLCSCYPWPVLGMPPTWYKSPPYRARAVSRAARGARASSASSSATTSRSGCGTRAPRSATWCCRCARAAPRAGARTELAAIVTRDCMIGTALPIVRESAVA